MTGRASRKEARRNGKQKRASRYENNVYHMEDFDSDRRIVLSAKDLTPKNTEQRKYMNTIKNTTVTVGIGEPGTGKTFIPSVLATQEIISGNSPYEQMVLIRPNEPLGKSLGMLPGDLFAKLEPWLEPIADGVRWTLGDSKNGKAYKSLVERGVIQFCAVEHVRGRTFNNAYVIVDEAQNVTLEAMMCILTRIGQDCKLIICGDINQKDIKTDSGLGLLMQMYQQYETLPFSMIELRENVRSAESKAFHAIFKDMGLVP